MADRTEIVDRLRGTNRGLQVSSDARSRHVAALATALKQRPAQQAPVPPARSGARRVSVAVALVLAVLIGFSTASAAATSNVVPGDTLYRAKRIAETLVSFTDGDLIPTNRLDELEILIARRSDTEAIRTARADAERALADRDADSRLWSRWHRLALPSPPEDGAADRPVVLAEVDWALGEVFSAALPTGDVITIAASGGEPGGATAGGSDVAVTGEWVFEPIADGWHLTNDRVSYDYIIDVVDGGIASIVGSTGPRSPEGQAADAAMEADDEGESGAAVEVDPGPGPATTRPSESPQAPRADDDQPEAEQADDVDPDDPTPSTAVPGQTSPPTTTAANATTITRPTVSAPAPSTSVTTTARPTITTATTAPPTTTSTTSPPPTAPPTTAPPTTAPTTTAAPFGPWTFFLLNPGAGATSSSTRLPLGSGPIVGGLLPNYDTNRDDAPGLLLAKDGAGLSTNDSTKYQEWEWSFDQPTRLDGAARFTIWLGAKDFAGGESIGVQVAVDLCSPGCVRLGTGQWSGASLSAYRGVTINLGSIDTAVAAGSTLKVRIVVPDTLATTDLWFAYDTVNYPSRLVIE